MRELSNREKGDDGFLDRVALVIGRQAHIVENCPVVWSCGCGLNVQPPRTYAQTFLFRDWHWGDGTALKVFALRERPERPSGEALEAAR